MNSKEKKLAEKIGVAIEEIWSDYYTDEGIGVGDIEPKAAVQYERLIDNIAEIIYKVGENNREVHMIKDLDAFEKAMQEKYPYLVEVRAEEIVFNDNRRMERYTAWLKFPYFSTDSDGGFFTFFDEEEFEKWITSACMFTEEEIKRQAFEPCQYEEFYDDEVFNLDKALYLFYKARIEMSKIKTEDKSMTSENLNEYLDENLPKVKFEEPKVFKVTIEEHINQIFEVEATDLEEAMRLAEERYYKGEYVLDCEANVSERLMSVEDHNGDFTNWIEF